MAGSSDPTLAPEAAPVARTLKKGGQIGRAHV